MATSKAYHHGDLKRALVEKCLTYVEKHGAAAVSLREIATLAKVSHGAPYRHFDDREELLAAVASEGFALLAKQIEDAMRSGRGRSKLRAIGGAYLRFAMQRPNLHRHMFAQKAGPDAGRAFAMLLRAAEDRKEAVRAWSLVHGLSILVRDGLIAKDEPAVQEFLAH